MIPSVVSGQVRSGIEEFLLTTFPVTTPLFQQSLPGMLRKEGSVFRGPYLSLELPFRTGEKGTRHFPEVLPEVFRPHRHQRSASSTPSSTTAPGRWEGRG